jgi:hypothetical protein
MAAATELKWARRIRRRRTLNIQPRTSGIPSLTATTSHSETRLTP